MPVHSLAHSPLSAASVRELLAMPAMPPVPEEEFYEYTEAELGWEFTDLVCDAVLTRHHHVLWYEGAPLGDPEATLILTFGEAYPVEPPDPDEYGRDALVELIGDWAALPGWELLEEPALAECEAVLDRAAEVVVAELGPPLRTLRADDRLGLGPHLWCRIWRMGEHGVVLAPREDGGPYGYLTHLTLTVHPWPAGEELPAGDEDCLRLVRDRIVL
ncbi:hypothetical protein EDD93_5205 [Streptomyces sp. 840.1]|uniref:hypothetical protein n=1 Tax=Streptomyces sp. 840.1 TaxID=2485152 RepID=UPI000F487C1B|nr:hypothetical protein [Streptomyces sp. 840.1]ROQ70681.1 hypothetical protein EDD93_5205 [Streptomyces sp. 840.1]